LTSRIEDRVADSRIDADIAKLVPVLTSHKQFG